MATYKQFQLAKNKGHGTFKEMVVTGDVLEATKVYVEFYSNAGKGFGANKRLCTEEKYHAKEQFFKLFVLTLNDFAQIGWESRVSFEFGDDE